VGTYDQGPNGIGHLTGMSDSSGSTVWTYDLHGRIISKAATVAGETLTTQYAYRRTPVFSSTMI